MKKKLFIYILTFIQISILGQVVNYTASTDVIANPERGLQKYSITGSNYSTSLGSNNLPISTLNSWRNSSDKVTVVYRYFMLDAFINTDINSIYLNNIQNDFNNIRTAGLKVIIRFAYSDKQGAEAQQPSKAQILKHIQQLTATLTSNKDVIFSVQAGFIGTWGEWYYTNSSEFGSDGEISATQWENRKEIINAMLDMVPTDIPIQVRYVGIKKTMYGLNQLTESTAYKSNANSRIGFYNDAFLNNYGDMGTFSAEECTNPVGTVDYNYLANETKYLPMTGETNGINPCDNGYRTTGQNAIYEMGLTNWTALNRDYHEDFWNNLSTIHYNEIVKNLGYRFSLKSSILTTNANGFNIRLNIENLGFARPYMKRDVYLVLKNTETNVITTQILNTDIRTWEGTVAIAHDITNIDTGSYNLFLWMPDNNVSLRTNSKYSIRLANDGIWNDENGYNNLLQTVTFKTLGLNGKLPNNELTVYPNPASDFINIKTNSFIKEDIDIYNFAGQLIKRIKIANEHKLDISKFINGEYIIRFSSNPEKSIKFIKY